MCRDAEVSGLMPPNRGGMVIVEALLTIGILFAASREMIDAVRSVYSNRCLDVQGIRRDVEVSGLVPPNRGRTAIVESVLTIGTWFAVSRETIDPVSPRI